MKIALFALGVLAFAQGIHLEDGSSMEVDFDYEEDGPGTACITPPCDGRPPPRNFCHGFAEIRTFRRMFDRISQTGCFLPCTSIRF